MKLCKDCNVNERYVSKSGKKNSYCSSCMNIRTKRYFKTDKGKAAINKAVTKWRKTESGRESTRKTVRNHQRRKRGFTPEMFNDMLFNQDFKCAICSVEINVSSHADHDHDTGKARGILCSSCNTLLGRLESKGFDWVDRAKAYLERTNQSS